MAEGSSFLKTAFLAVAGCVIVHGAFDFIALAGGPNFWDILVDPVTDGFVWLFNATVATPAVAAPAAALPAAVPVGAEQFIAPIENTIPEGCHTHLDGTVHCGPDGPASVEW